jgi:hypothetical protein
VRDDEILGWVRDERLSLADFLDGLDGHEWRLMAATGRAAAVQRIGAAR